MKNENSTTIAKINNVSILMIEDGESLVPIKPICEALGIDHDSQRRKIKENEILSSVMVLSYSTGKDGKQHKMTCIPYKFIFGWLFTINAKNVKKDARENLLKTKLEYYNAFYDMSITRSHFLQQKQEAIIKRQQKNIDNLEKKIIVKKDTYNIESKRLKEIMSVSFEEWQANNDIIKNIISEKAVDNE